jgi:hypothetical protein
MVVDLSAIERCRRCRRGWCTARVLFTGLQRLVEHGHWVNAQGTIGKYNDDSGNPR